MERVTTETEIRNIEDLATNRVLYGQPVVWEMDKNWMVTSTKNGKPYGSLDLVMLHPDGNENDAFGHIAVVLRCGAHIKILKQSQYRNIEGKPCDADYDDIVMELDGWRIDYALDNLGVTDPHDEVVEPPAETHIYSLWAVDANGEIPEDCDDPLATTKATHDAEGVTTESIAHHAIVWAQSKCRLVFEKKNGTPAWRWVSKDSQFSAYILRGMTLNGTHVSLQIYDNQ